MKNKVTVSLNAEDKKLIARLIDSTANVRTPEEAILWALRNYRPPSLSVGTPTVLLDSNAGSHNNDSSVIVGQTGSPRRKFDFNQPPIEPDPARANAGGIFGVSQNPTGISGVSQNSTSIIGSTQSQVGASQNSVSMAKSSQSGACGASSNSAGESSTSGRNEP